MRLFRAVVLGAERTPRPTWGALAFVFGCTCALAIFATWQEAGATPLSRFALAAYGCLAIEAARRAGLWRAAFRCRRMTILLAIAAAVGAIILTFPQDLLSMRPYTQEGTSYSDLKQSGLALLQYAQDYDDKLPPNTDSISIRSYLVPYLGLRGVSDTTSSVLFNRVSGRPYVWRRALRGKAISSLKDPGAIVVAYSPEELYGKRVVLFLDGDVHEVSETDFRDLLRKQPLALLPVKHT